MTQYIHHGDPRCYGNVVKTEDHARLHSPNVYRCEKCAREVDAVEVYQVERAQPAVAAGRR